MPCARISIKASRSVPLVIIEKLNRRPAVYIRAGSSLHTARGLDTAHVLRIDRCDNAALFRPAHSLQFALHRAAQHTRRVAKMRCTLLLLATAATAKRLLPKALTSPATSKKYFRQYRKWQKRTTNRAERLTRTSVEELSGLLFSERSAHGRPFLSRKCKSWFSHGSSCGARNAAICTDSGRPPSCRIRLDVGGGPELRVVRRKTRDGLQRLGDLCTCRHH